jgi:hypothetical protein
VATHTAYHDNKRIRFIKVKDKQGKLHNSNGPAHRVWYNNNQIRLMEYRYNNKRHRTDGPAFQYWHESGQLFTTEYWLNGKEFTKEEFTKRVTKYSKKGNCV